MRVLEHISVSILRNKNYIEYFPSFLPSPPFLFLMDDKGGRAGTWSHTAGITVTFFTETDTSTFYIELPATLRNYLFFLAEPYSL